MPSPVFVSNPSSNFSPIAILIGSQLAIVGTYRLLQNQLFFENAQNFRFVLFCLYISIGIQILLALPTWAITLLGLPTTYANTINYFHGTVLNLPTIIPLIFHCIYISQFDDIFLGGMRFASDVSGEDYWGPLHASPKAEYEIPWSNGVRRVLKLIVKDDKAFSIAQTNHLTRLFRSYAMLTARIIALNICCHSPWFAHTLVSLQVARSFNSIIGTNAASLMFAAGWIAPPYYMIVIYSFFHSTLLLIGSLLTMPYFQRLRLTNQQAGQWVDSRIGLAFGFGLVFQLLSQRLAYLSLLLLMLEQLALAFFVFKTTDPLPESLSDTWVLRQIYWSKEYDLDDLWDIIDAEVFRTFSGSYSFSDAVPGSTSTTSFNTPLTSSTNLQELTINTVD